MIEIVQQPFAPYVFEMKDLFDLHWNEVYGHTNRKADIMLDFYLKMEAAGFAFILYAYYDQTVVGYSVNFLAPNIHCAGHLSCNNDALFVDPDFRDTPLGLRLIRRTEQEAKARGADLMIWNAPLNTNLIKILPRLGYSPLEQVLVKEI